MSRTTRRQRGGRRPRAVRVHPGRPAARTRAGLGAAREPALRGHFRLGHGADPDAQGGDELRRRRAGARCCSRFPAWTPGAYELSFFARWVSNFTPEAGGQALAWDKLDYDTWRIQPNGAKSVTVRFDYLADTLDNAMAWSRPDFVLFNGTNVLPYPEGRGPDFPATVTIKTEPAWLVATGMQAVPRQPGSYREGNYHDLVDKPFFIGRMDYDSTQVDGRWTRLATYPAGMLTGAARSQTLDQIGKMIPAEASGIPGDAVAALHGHDDLRFGLRRRQRARAHQLARRHLQPGLHRQSDPGVDHRARDLPRLERQAAPAGRHGPLPLRPERAHALALGQRRDHRLLRRPGHPARGHHHTGDVPRPHRGQDREGGRGAAHGARGRVALDLDPSDRRQRVPLLSRRARSRASCWT